MKILALDNLQKVGLDVFAREGIEVDVKGKMTPEGLASGKPTSHHCRKVDGDRHAEL